MLTISKPLSASQAQAYHAKEFTAAEQNYWKQGDAIQGEWQGRLVDKFGLEGAVGQKNLPVSPKGNIHEPVSSWCAIERCRSTNPKQARQLLR